MSGVDPFQSTRPHGARRSSRCPGRGHHWRFNPRARMGRDRDGQPVMRSKLVFQSTRPHGARQQTGPADQGRRWRFNPRARMGRDAPAPVMADGQPQVSIHAPAWGATRLSGRVRPQSLFQSTRPHGARPWTKSIARPGIWFQSTRPHGARQIAFCRGQDKPEVSIHAPAWGATMAWTTTVLPLQPVSIHAPAWGATLVSSRSVTVPSMFQSTRPHGARLDLRRRAVVHQLVLIHAPAWGATGRGPWLSPGRRAVSIHAPAWGATWGHWSR